MKPSHIAHLAGAISPRASHCPPAIDFRYDMMPGKEPYHPSRAETNAARRKKTSSSSQRQTRKNRRRAHAAGMRHAFAC
jgi:hypothetical protein